MANVKISDLTAATVIGSGDLFEIETAGAASRKITDAVLAEFIRDTIGACLVQGSNMTITVNDAGDTITLASAGGGGSAQFNPEYVSGRYIPALQNAGPAFTTVAMTANVTRLFPFCLPKALTASRLALRVSSPVAGNMQAAIYNNVSGSAKPGALVDSCASVSSNTLGINDLTPSLGNLALSAGVLYWAAFNFDATPTVLVLPANNQAIPQIVGSATGNNVLGTTTYLCGYNFVQTFGTWSSDLSAQSLTESTTAFVPGLALKVA